MSIEEKRIQVMAIVDKLPQRQFISEESIDAWINQVLSLGDHDPVWHARRLRGIGSSEIGACVMSARGEHTPFGGAREMVMSKLMRLAPDAGTGDTKRGNEMEDFIRQMFHRQFSTKSETEIMNKMMKTVIPDAPWMVGNPDDVCVINGKRYLVDYKAPSTEVLVDIQKAGGVKFEYACQLHHLAEIGRRAGFQIDGMLLCSLDWKNWALDVREVVHDQALMDEIFAVGGELWNEFVCKGDLPAMDISQPYEGLTDDERNELFALAERFAIANGIAKEAGAYADEIKNQILGITRNHRIGNEKIELPGGYVKSKPVLDLESLVAYAGMFDIDLDTEKPESIQAAIKYLEEQGYPKEKFEADDQKFRASLSKKGVNFEFIQACSEIGQATLIEKLTTYQGSFLSAFGVTGAANQSPEKNLETVLANNRSHLKQ